MRRVFSRPTTAEAERVTGLAAEKSVLGDVALAYEALDAVQANIFIADPRLNLVYMNRRATATMKALAPKVQEAFGVRFDDVVGGSIHRFHRNPRRVEQILQDPNFEPYDAAFTFGAVTLDTHINRIVGADGQVAGYVVAWEDVSTKRLSEQRARGLAERLGETQEVSAAIQ